MIYGLYPTTEGAYNLYFEELDGDYDKVDMVDKSTDRSTTRITSTHAFRVGREIETEYLPTRLRPKKRKGKLPDLAVHRMGQICSQRFRDVIEALEPGVHQFVPVQIVWKDKSVDERPYYWFVPCTRIWALDPEESNPPLGENGWYLGYAMMGEPRPGPIQPAFRKDRVKNHHLFVDGGIQGRFYISERLKAALEDAKLVGVGFSDPLPLI